MIVVVTGSRSFPSFAIVHKCLAKLQGKAKAAGEPLIVVHGAARGVDAFADTAAKFLGCEVRTYPADWQRFGKRAGPQRNREMLDKECPDLVIGFLDTRSLPGVSGTLDCLRAAEERKLTWDLYTE